MRKVLLATVAMVGTSGGMMGLAFAQAPAAAPAPMGQPSMKVLVPENFGKSANDNNNYQPAELPGAVANPTPGTMVVRLNGKLWSEIGVGGGSGSTDGTFKVAPDSIGTYFRLYPGVNAMATNGLRYGAQVEIRENFRAISTGSNTTAGSSNNAIATTGQTGGSPLTCGQTLYVRRAFVYVAGANWGMIRMGQTDGVTGTFDNGVISPQQVGQGLWNGDAPGFVMGPAAVTFPWLSQQGAEYGTNKIFYLSPQFAGFDFGIDWAANNGNQEGGSYTPASGVPALSSSAVLGDGARFMNMYKAGVRYQGTFGPLSIYGFGAYIGSGHVQYTGSVAAAAATGPLGNTYNGSFKNLSAGFGGVSLTYAGVSLAGGWQGGQYNETMALTPVNGTNAQAWSAALSYSAGPYTIGAAYYQFDDQGNVALTGISQQHQDAFGAGANYQAAPGLQFYAEYVWGQRHQGDLNYVTGATGTSVNNNVHTQAFIVGTLVGW